MSNPPDRETTSSTLHFAFVPYYKSLAFNALETDQVPTSQNAVPALDSRERCLLVRRRCKALKDTAIATPQSTRLRDKMKKLRIAGIRIAPTGATAIATDVAVKHSARVNERMGSGINSGAIGRFRGSDYRATYKPKSVVAICNRCNRVIQRRRLAVMRHYLRINGTDRSVTADHEPGALCSGTLTATFVSQPIATR